jgi:hypothetical protein
LPFDVKDLPTDHEQFVSRSFAPAVGIDEDPVTGSALLPGAVLESAPGRAAGRSTVILYDRLPRSWTVATCAPLSGRSVASRLQAGGRCPGASTMLA